MQHYFHRHRALAGSIASAGLGCGTLITSPLMMLGIENYGMRGGLLILAAMSLQCLVPAMLLFPHPRIKNTYRKSNDQVNTLNVNSAKNNELDPCITCMKSQNKIKDSC